MISKEFVNRRFKPKLPEWKQWRDHMNRQLMHLSYGRVDNTVSWNGSANAPLLKEFTRVWADFLLCLNPLYTSEFQTQLKSRGM